MCQVERNLGVLLSSRPRNTHVNLTPEWSVGLSKVSQLIPNPSLKVRCSDSQSNILVMLFFFFCFKTRVVVFLSTLYFTKPLLLIET